MGNCLRVEGEIIKVTETDGKVLEYRRTPPMKVHEEEVSGFMGQGISTTLPVSQHHLQPKTELTGGNNMHYLVPLPNRPPKVGKKVRFSMPPLDETDHSPKTTGLRIKLVISKQELEKMIENGAVSVDRIASKLRKDDDDDDDDCVIRNRAWKPVLNSIPEID